MKKEQSRSEQDFVQAFQLGQEKAFDYFFRENFASLCLFAGNYLSDPEDARDIVQECFVKLWSRHAVMRNPQAIKSFLYTTVKNACIIFLQSRQTMQRHSTEAAKLLDKIDHSWLDQVTHAEMIHTVHAQVRLLPPRMQEVFKKYFFEGKKCREIALELHTSPSTVRNQKTKALTLLREKLGVIISLILFFL